MECGKVISRLRLEQGRTQKEIADYLGVGNTLVSQWEIGVRMPNVPQLMALADYFKVSVDELLGRGDKA